MARRLAAEFDADDNTIRPPPILYISRHLNIDRARRTRRRRATRRPCHRRTTGTARNCRMRPSRGSSPRRTSAPPRARGARRRRRRRRRPRAKRASPRPDGPEAQPVEGAVREEARGAGRRRGFGEGARRVAGGERAPPAPPPPPSIKTISIYRERWPRRASSPSRATKRLLDGARRTTTRRWRGASRRSSTPSPRRLHRTLRRRRATRLPHTIATRSGTHLRNRRRGRRLPTTMITTRTYSERWRRRAPKLRGPRGCSLRSTNCLRNNARTTRGRHRPPRRRPTI